MTGASARLLAAAAGEHSSLVSAGRQSSLIEHLWWVFAWTTGTVYVLVMFVVIVLSVRARRRQRTPTNADEPRLSDAARESGVQKVVGACVAATVFVLFALMLSDFVTGRRYHALSKDADVNVKVIARQWWWEVQYVDSSDPSRTLVTANELVLPVGKTVRVELQARDVIHSFWLPSLAGKKDAIPGHPTSVWLRPDEVGTFEGQCAEFCGLAHAKMRLLARVTPQAEYDAWYEHQLSSPAEPTTGAQKRGRDVLVSTTCVLCHTVAGTPARGSVGPNLTHVGGRQTLAAGSLPNTPEHMAGWIVDPPGVKPGVRMPQHNLSPEDLGALVEYLESLK